MKRLLTLAVTLVMVACLSASLVWAGNENVDKDKAYDKCEKAASKSHDSCLKDAKTQADRDACWDRYRDKVKECDKDYGKKNNTPN